MTHRDRPGSAIARHQRMLTKRPLLACLATVLAFAYIAAIVAIHSSTTAAAASECTNPTPTTTQCQNPGNVQINTSPGVTTSPFMGWPWWYGYGPGVTVVPLITPRHR
jgi:hypothetical protein